MRRSAWDNAAEQSWAVVDWVQDGFGWRVRESGPRSLWAEAEAAYRTWSHLGEPSADRYALRIVDGLGTVELDGQHVADLPVGRPVTSG